MWTCTRQVGTAILVISLAELPTPDAAGRALDTLAMMTAESGEDELVPKLKEEPGLGDRAMSGASSIGTIWAVVRGRHMLSLSLSGEGIDGPRYREPLKRLTTRALSKI